MAQSYSVEAILSAQDNMSNVFRNAASNASSMSSAISNAASGINVKMAAAGAAVQTYPGPGEQNAGERTHGGALPASVVALLQKTSQPPLQLLQIPLAAISEQQMQDTRPACLCVSSAESCPCGDPLLARLHPN